MPLAPFDVLVGVVAVRSGPLLGGLDALGIHYCRRCIGVPAYSVPLSATQGPVNEAPRSAKAQFPEVIVDGRPWREVVGQKPPMAATFEYVEDGVENIAQGVGTRSSLGLWGGQARAQTPPLSIGKVGRIRLSHRRQRTKPS